MKGGHTVEEATAFYRRVRAGVLERVRAGVIGK